MKFKKVFIGGCPRSGTTWVNQIIARHPDAVSIKGEGHLFDLIYDYAEHPNGTHIANRIVCNPVVNLLHLKTFAKRLINKFVWKQILYEAKRYLKDGSSPLLFVEYPRLKELIKREVAKKNTNGQKAKNIIKTITEDYFLRNSGKDLNRILVEKTPQNIKYFDLIFELFPDAKFIEVMRDGRDVCVSLNKLGAHWCPNSIKEQINMWIYYINKGRRMKKLPKIAKRMLTVKYETLKKHPKQTIKNLYNFIGLKYSDKFIDEVIYETNIDSIKDKGEGKSIRKGIVGDWRNNLTSHELEIIKTDAAETMRKVGYEW